MSDITSTNLELAILDQKVAGQFSGRLYAYQPVLADHGWKLGIAVQDERGYNPIDGLSYKTESEAKEVANGMNEHIGLNRDQALHIIISTMRG